ncbi:MAG: hypothetical protein NVSMB13_18130 [Mycobacteriales bacterium]
MRAEPRPRVPGRIGGHHLGMILFWLRRFLIMTVLAPLAGRGLHLAAARVRERRGPSPAADRLEQAGTYLRTSRRRRRRY